MVFIPRWVLAVFVCLASFAGCGFAADRDNKPNFIVIFADESNSTKLAAVCKGKWKLHLPKMVSNGKKKSGVHKVVAELYDLSTDTSESNNVAFVNPGVVNELTEAAEASDKELRLDSREPGKVKE